MTAWGATWRVAGALAAALPMLQQLKPAGLARCMEDPFAAKNFYEGPRRLVPVWERGITPVLTSWRNAPPVLGDKLVFPRPPPLPPPRALPSFDFDNVNMHPCAQRPPKMRRLNWPKQPVDIDAERQIEITKWRSIIEAVGPERCKLAHDLMYARNDEDKWRTLAVFHLKALDSTRLDYGGP